MDRIFLDKVAKVLGISPDKLNRDSSSKNTPQWDSIAHWEIIAVVEQAYSTEFTMDEAVEFKNLGELYDALLKRGVT